MDPRPELWNSAISKTGIDLYTEYVKMSQGTTTVNTYMTDKSFDYMIINTDTGLYTFVSKYMSDRYKEVVTTDDYALFEAIDTTIATSSASDTELVDGTVVNDDGTVSVTETIEGSDVDNVAVDAVDDEQELDVATIDEDNLVYMDTAAGDVDVDDISGDNDIVAYDSGATKIMGGGTDKVQEKQ
jgi:hypothetical protein